ncbi:MAG TPA: cyanase [Polyangiales bacterium]
MERAEITRLLLEAKKRKGMSFEQIAAAIDMGEVFVASLFYGENSATPETAHKLGQLLDLSEPLQTALAEYPLKGNSLGARTIPTDPLLYRFYEVLAVYGLPLKDVIQEKFGDGIMSAIDFTMDVQKQTDPKGDRVLITMSGKFLAYKRW